MKRFNWYLFLYEFKSAIANGFSFFFGIVFPILLSAIIMTQIHSEAPAEVVPQVATSLYLGFAMLIPLSVGFIGYSANYSTELESCVQDRLELFGYRHKTIFIAKMISNLLFVTLGLMIFTLYGFLGLKILNTSLFTWIIFIVLYYLFSISLILLSHSIASLIRRFGLTYFVTMVLYFTLLVLSGMMGIQSRLLPTGIQWLVQLMPPKFFRDDFIRFWMGQSYNFIPLLQAILFWFILALVVFLINLILRERKK